MISFKSYSAQATENKRLRPKLCPEMDGKCGCAVFFFGLVFALNIVSPNGLPLANDSDDDDAGYSFTNVTYQTVNNTDGTSKDLIVIRTTIYEVGILTDADDDDSTEIREQVDLTFFDPASNQTAIDLSNIPIPIQANISGISVTGIAPGSLGVISLPNGTDTNKNFSFTSPVLPNALIKVSHNVSTTNKDKTQEILSQISPLIDIPQLQLGNSWKNNSGDVDS